MDIELDDLNETHPRLPIEIARLLGTRAALGLQRRGHLPVCNLVTRIETARADHLLKWTQLDINELPLHDVLRVTEDGAEGIALAVVGSRLRWRVLRRLQREEHADWLLEDPNRDLIAFEVSGLDRGNISQRVSQKRRQVRDAEDVDQRWAAVVSFEEPTAVIERAD